MAKGDDLIYDGPTIPTVYDPNWQRFSNLTDAQKAAFSAFPEFLLFYAGQRRWMAEQSGVTVNGIPLTTLDIDRQNIGELKQAFDVGAIVGGTVAFADATGNVHTVDGAAATAIYMAVVAFVQSTRTVYADVAAKIKATPQVITKPSQVDAAFAAIAPNSPSALIPSPI